MHFEIVGHIERVEVIGVGGEIRDTTRFRGSSAPAVGASSKESPEFVWQGELSAALRCTGMKRMG